MSDCSTNAFKTRGIGGYIVWQGLPASPLAFARYVNGTERVAKYIELDGEMYERVKECELEYHDTGWVSCRECNTSWKNDRPHVYRRCPYCGAKLANVGSLGGRNGNI